MLLLSLVINQYIIEVYHYKYIDKWPKQLSHRSHEGARSIGHFKEHNQSFIQPILDFKGSFSFIFWPNFNLVVPTLKINFREDCDTWHQIQHIIKMRNEKAILDSYIVYCAVIHTYVICHPFLAPKVRELHTGSNFFWWIAYQVTLLFAVVTLHAQQSSSFNGACLIKLLLELSQCRMEYLASGQFTWQIFLEDLEKFFQYRFNVSWDLHLSLWLSFWATSA